jgi:LL-diaminopimelate aminotransferase
MIQTADRLKGIGEYYFSQKLRAIDEMNKQGPRVINLGIGSPDLPPHTDVISILQQEAARPDTHAYQSYKGAQVLREAMSHWYKTWYHVSLDPNTEILPLIGSKEGIMHICMTYLNAGDEALVPNPGYPTYGSAVRLSGATPREYLLDETNSWQPDWDKLEQENLDRVKLMFVNYPHMPSGRLPDMALFEKLIDFARRKNILLVHDNPYSFILNDNPMSILSAPGAKDVAIELNSLSKSLNMAGWRVGMLCGAAKQVSEVLVFKSNMDSGMFLPVQLAAAKALQLDHNWYAQLNDIYCRRKELAKQVLELLGCAYTNEQAGLFLWGKIPEKYADAYELSDEILIQKRVFITPGGIFGSQGNAYLRISLCQPEKIIEEALTRISAV